MCSGNGRPYEKSGTPALPPGAVRLAEGAQQGACMGAVGYRCLSDVAAWIRKAMNLNAFTGYNTTN